MPIHRLYATKPTLSLGNKTGRYSPPVHVGPQMVRWIFSELRRDRERMIAERNARITEAA